MDVQNVMNFGVLVRAKRAEVHQRPLPPLGENDVLIKQETCNICTTDYGQWLGLREHQPYPMAGGHEGAGIIIKKGSKVRKDLEIGDRVALGYYHCGECDPCRSGHSGDCVNLKIPKTDDGYYGYFGFSDYNVKDARFVFKIDNNVLPEHGGFLEPIATVINGLKRLRVKAFENVVVIGAGTMGLVNAQVARAMGCRVIITELIKKKIDCAKSLGFEVVDASRQDPIKEVKDRTKGKGADAVIVSVGANKANYQGLDMVKKFGGRILFFAAGYPAPEMKINTNDIHYRKLELIGTFGADLQDFNDSAKLLNSNILNLEPLIEEHIPLAEIQKAFEVASTKGNYRVTVVL